MSDAQDQQGKAPTPVGAAGASSPASADMQLVLGAIAVAVLWWLTKRT